MVIPSYTVHFAVVWYVPVKIFIVFFLSLDIFFGNGNVFVTACVPPLFWFSEVIKLSSFHKIIIFTAYFFTLINLLFTDIVSPSELERFICILLVDVSRQTKTRIVFDITFHTFKKSTIAANCAILHNYRFLDGWYRKCVSLKIKSDFIKINYGVTFLYKI